MRASTSKGSTKVSWKRGHCCWVASATPPSSPLVHVPQRLVTEPLTSKEKTPRLTASCPQPAGSIVHQLFDEDSSLTAHDPPPQLPAYFYIFWQNISMFLSPKNSRTHARARPSLFVLRLFAFRSRSVAFCTVGLCSFSYGRLFGQIAEDQRSLL